MSFVVVSKLRAFLVLNRDPEGDRRISWTNHRSNALRFANAVQALEAAELFPYAGAIVEPERILSGDDVRCLSALLATSGFESLMKVLPDEAEQLDDLVARGFAKKVSMCEGKATGWDITDLGRVVLREVFT